MRLLTRTILVCGAASINALSLVASMKTYINRRSLFLQPGAAAMVASIAKPTIAAAASPPSVFDGMSAFASGDVERSIDIYDSIISKDPRRKPYLWQRGLSLYYANRYQEGAEQFAADVAVNPNDTEEQIWHLLCLAQIKGSLEAARPFKLNVGRDRRPVMRAAQSLFLSGVSEDERRLIDTSEIGDKSAKFYASLYLSLYHESMGDLIKAEKWMVQAVGTEYAQVSGTRDPMVELAKVAIQKRGWSHKRL